MAKENLSIQIEYEKKEGGVVLKKLHGRCAELHVPAKIDGLPVIAVAERAFAAEKEAPHAEIGEEKEASLSFVTEPPAETAEGQALRRVFLPDTIAEIGAFAFSGCAALERVHLPERLTAVSKRMFDGCGALQEISLPRAVRRIGDYAFYGCTKLKQVSIGKGASPAGERGKHRAVCLL